MTGPEGLCSGSRTEVTSQELEGATSDLSPVYYRDRDRTGSLGRRRTLPSPLPADSVQIDQ